MNCPVCGTPVKVVGKTTQHYEPIRLSKERIEKLILDMQETIEKREKAPTHILQSDRFKLAEQIHNAINTKE